MESGASTEKRWWAQKNPEKYRAYMEKNREKFNACRRKWRAENKEKVHEYNKRSGKKKYLKNKEKILGQHFRKMYGISREEYFRRLSDQGGVCAICKKEESQYRGGEKIKLALDHCHRTGMLRGILCSSCNNVLARAKDDSEVLRKAAEYLDHYAKDGMNGRDTNSREG